LSHSRKGYSEVVWRQDTEAVIRCIENAFRAFGGVNGGLIFLLWLGYFYQVHALLVL
ncbi:MAG: hypothetical protein H3C27_13305, partial [Opitutaceae bacterium]|nr:hypothetical protein [Opitutaceae bacterium]